MTNLDSLLKSLGLTKKKKKQNSAKQLSFNKKLIKKKRYHFTDKGLFSQSDFFFPVVIYGCDSWTIKKAEH